MKKLSTIALLFLILLSGCINWNDDRDLPKSDYEPVILSRTEFEYAISLASPKIILETGKIYIFSNYLFINEPNKGFHIFNNSNPSNPIKIGFLDVPGSTDIAIKNNIFYVNSAVDLIAIKINPSYSSLEITKRVKNIFPVMNSPDGFAYYDLQENEIIINWILKD